MNDCRTCFHFKFHPFTQGVVPEEWCNHPRNPHGVPACYQKEGRGYPSEGRPSVYMRATGEPCGPEGKLYEPAY